MSARLDSLLGGVDHEILGDDGSAEVTDVTQDTRAVVPGALYCCVVGATVDGHTLAADAVRAGARSLLVERWVDERVPQVRVDSSRRTVGPVAAAFFGHPSEHLTVVGVTGTNGKTTTTHLIAAVLGAAGTPTAVLGTLSGERTTPEGPILQRRLAAWRDEGFGAVAMEVSSIALDQHRVDGTLFKIGVWTNLTQDHLDYHGDMDAYFAAKARLFDMCETAVVNADDPSAARLLSALRIPGVTYGLGLAGRARTDRDGTHFAWHGHAVDLPLAGDHNISNALAAATVGEVLGVDAATIARGLSEAPPVAGRWERIDRGQRFEVVVDYAHTPDGLEKILSAARAAAGPEHKVLVVFGCGGDRDRAKRPLMGEVAGRLADVAVLTSDNPRSEDPMAIIAEAAVGAHGPGALEIEPDRRLAIASAFANAGPGDVVVIAGKGHETGQTIGGVVHPFDDRAVAAELLDGGAWSAS